LEGRGREGVVVERIEIRRGPTSWVRREIVSAADKLQGRGPTGYLSYSIITRWKPPSLSYLPRWTQYYCAVEVDSFLQIRYKDDVGGCCAEKRGGEMEENLQVGEFARFALES
jgi:hypothetical protein